jgi:hypothetical protein
MNLQNSNIKDLYNNKRKLLTFRHSVKFEENGKKYIIRKFKLDQVLPLKNYIMSSSKHPSFIVSNLVEYREDAMYVLQENYDVSLYSYLKDKSFEERLAFLPKFISQMFNILVYLDSINICYNGFNPYNIRIDGKENIHLVNFNNITYKLNINNISSNIKQKDDFGHIEDKSYHNGYNDIFSMALLILYILTDKLPYYRNNYEKKEDVLHLVYKSRSDYDSEKLEIMEPFLNIVNKMLNNYSLSKINYMNIYPVNKEEIDLDPSYVEEVYNSISLDKNRNITNIKDIKDIVIALTTVLYQKNSDVNLTDVINFVIMMITSDYDCKTDIFIKFWRLVIYNDIFMRNLNIQGF